MAVYKTPGVYIEEVSKLPPSIPTLETAILALIGYTEKADRQGVSLSLVATKVYSLLDYESLFGGAARSAVTLWLDAQDQVIDATIDQPFYLYDSVRLFFANGGGSCVIVSVGNYNDQVSAATLAAGLNAIEKDPLPTLIAIPETALCRETHTLEATALAQCAQLQNRFALFDLRLQHNPADLATEAERFRQSLGMDHLKYGAAYGPWLVTSLARTTDFNQLVFKRKGDGSVVSAESLTQDQGMQALMAQIHAAGLAKMTTESQAQLASLNQKLYAQYVLAKQWIDAANIALNTLPASGAVAGVYAAVDQKRGVWKAPANESLDQVIRPVLNLTSAQQQDYNVDVNAGKSINIIRKFTGKGTQIWGARTLAGNDNEWRYIPVRRLFSWVEVSVSQGLQQMVFEPNDANTWVRAQAMIENFLILLWRQGALQGSKPEQAFFVNIGLGKTMTANDIAQGLMRIEMGMAVVRPAEFIILKLTVKQAG
ncbi:phage tail sheath C-terminal domain-containing protein [Methylophilus sp. Q8]|uniref:phage tail sheath family protein n=1 Tax=Methylophilus sp. Q8 TaxID=1506586 RepID=UPI00064855DD|nr:phage tail sheath C-terminal domain-containing protein [Methylophilus sp. Q8]